MYSALELEYGWIRSNSHSYGQYAWKAGANALEDSSEVGQDILTKCKVVKTGKNAGDSRLNFEDEPHLGRTYTRVLHQWQSEGKIKDLKGSLNHQRHRILKEIPLPGSDEALEVANALYTKAEEKEIEEVNRLDRSLDLFEGDQCASYFSSVSVSKIS
jgi:hypothetical protein